MSTGGELEKIYAQLAARVYMRTDENRTPIPGGWEETRYIGNGQPSGFSAGVYHNGNDIVIVQGKRTVLEYFLSPVQRVASEAGMER